MVEIRSFRLAGGDYVVAFRGDLGAESALDLAAEVGRTRGRTIVVDLLRARPVDEGVLLSLVEAIGADMVYVAERPLLDMLLPVASRSVSTLAAALV